jgi:hypothetical protein
MLEVGRGANDQTPEKLLLRNHGRGTLLYVMGFTLSNIRMKGLTKIVFVFGYSFSP